MWGGGGKGGGRGEGRIVKLQGPTVRLSPAENGIIHEVEAFFSTLFHVCCYPLRVHPEKVHATREVC